MSYDNPNLAIVLAVIDQGLSVSQAARRFDKSRQWIYTLINRYKNGGPTAVQPRSTAPHTRPQELTRQLRAQIIAIRKELTAKGADNGPASIQWVMETRGLRTPSESTIRRVLHTHGLIQPQPKKRPKSSYIRFQASLPNECWQADVTHIRLADGTDVEVLDFLDDHSRFLLYIHAYPRVTGATVVAAMTAITATYGCPQSTLTDNGLVFTARLAGGKNGFETFLANHSIKQKNGAPNHPQTQGKIERFHQTLKKWIKAQPPAETIAQLQQQLHAFQHWYNTERPHRALGRQTPHQVYHDLPKATPQPLVTNDNRIRHDIVDKAGRITLRFAGTMRYLGIGRAHTGTPTLTIITGNEATTSNATTGEIIAEHIIDTDRRYQPNLLNT